jgi:hypothetical protein
MKPPMILAAEKIPACQSTGMYEPIRLQMVIDIYIRLLLIRISITKIEVEIEGGEVRMGGRGYAEISTTTPESFSADEAGTNALRLDLCAARIDQIVRTVACAGEIVRTELRAKDFPRLVNELCKACFRLTDLLLPFERADDVDQPHVNAAQLDLARLIVGNHSANVAPFLDRGFELLVQDVPDDSCRRCDCYCHASSLWL